MDLIPPDLERCQCEVHHSHSFVTLGSRRMTRCVKKPEWIATEKAKPNGQMSLCSFHAVKCLQKLENSVSLEEIEKE